MSLATSIESLRLMRLPEVLRITGFSRSTLLAMVARGDFPAPLRIGRRAVAWRAREVIAWIESRPRASETEWR